MSDNIEDTLSRIFGDESALYEEKSFRRREYLKKQTKHK